MKLRLTALAQTHAICHFPADAAFPDWVGNAGCVSVTRAPGELSVVCPANNVPKEVTHDGGWAAVHVETLAGLDEPGVVLAAVQPVSSNGFGVFVISTYLRDWVLVRSDALHDIAKLWTADGHTVTLPDTQVI